MKIEIENKEVTFTEKELDVPLNTLVINNKGRVNTKEMDKYIEIYMSIETTVMTLWKERKNVNDKIVLSAYKSLLRDFDHQQKGSLESEIAKCVKATLLMRKREKLKDFTYGEILSCIYTLIEIIKIHQSQDGIGYLKWVENFFTGNMPTTEKEMTEYMFKNEM